MTVAARSAICCRIEPEGLADNRESFWACVQCTTCTSVCPVVAVSEDPSRDLDLLPQQVMNLLRMGLKDETLGARMIWSCTTCYKCQEHCPQDIRVADVLYELRNTAAARLRQVEEG
jgi:heterodisulfide reductase subunit C